MEGDTLGLAFTSGGVSHQQFDAWGDGSISSGEEECFTRIAHSQRPAF